MTEPRTPAPATPDRHTFGPCTAQFDGTVLALADGHVRRTWRVDAGGGLVATELVDLATGRQWLSGPAQAASLVPAGGAVAAVSNRAWRMTRVEGRSNAVEQASLRIELASPGPAAPVYCFQLFPDAAGVTMSLRTAPAADRSVVARDHSSTATTTPTGVEESDRPAAAAPHADVIECLSIPTLHLRLTVVDLLDQTDGHDNLVFETSWLLHPAERPVERPAALAVVEDTLTGDGLIFLKLAPAPHARPVKNAIDVRAAWNQLTTYGHGLDAGGGDGYRHVTLAYRGGRAGRIAALQQYQRCLRPYVAGRDGLFLTNTWGDRGKDGRVTEAFVLGEVDAAARLAADVVQIDDGWQRGRTANSVDAGGVWNGFWAADPEFWAPHPQRFPRGLAPVVAAARGRGLRVGLWYAPDSSGDFANHRRDAAQILALHRDLGVDHVKIDGVKMRSKAGERNLLALYDLVLEASGGRVVFDNDVTAEVRPAYFGAPHAGTLFVENRYTDWHRYWPHHTLRNLWQLAQYVDPVRLRVEFLNTARHADLYADDPLAPARYDPAYLFASVMVASPLGWFEAQNLPPAYVERVAPLVRTWRQHRGRLHGGTIVPVGEPPDGTSWTGFASSDSRGDGYLLVFRELTTRGDRAIEVPMFDGVAYTAERLAGAGEVAVATGTARVTLPEPLSFAFARLTRQVM